jgi:murein L,D-transpeptidase YafK
MAIVLVIVAGILFYLRHNRNLLGGNIPIDRIVVVKSARTLSIFRGGKQLKTYRVALGHNPIGPKEEEGDMKTPEGIYKIDERKADSDYHLALHISYPSAEDTARATGRGVSAGSDIEIHGFPNGHGALGASHYLSDWTAGCIAVTNEEIDEIWQLSPVGTIVEIDP